MFQVILSLLVLLCTAVLTVLYLPETLGRIDLIQYWGSSKLLLSNLNPYDPHLLHGIERTAQPHTPLIRMWNPPFVFPIIFAMGFVEFTLLAGLWFWASCLMAVCCYGLLQRHWPWEPGSPSHPWRNPQLIFFLTFFPIADILSWGQISMLLLVGITGFFLLQKTASSSFYAGISLSITLIKPHLLLLLYLYLLIAALFAKSDGNSPSRRLFLGFLVGAALLTISSLLIHPEGFSEYLIALAEPPVYFKTPTIGSWLQELGGGQGKFWRFLPTGIAVISVFLLLLMNQQLRSSHKFELLLIPLSLVTSPYGWGYDQVLLLPIGLAALSLSKTSAHSRLIQFMAIAGNILYILIPGSLGQQALVWYPCWIFFLLWFAQRSDALSSSSSEPLQT